jgi:hypothetical protein
MVQVNIRRTGFEDRECKLDLRTEESPEEFETRPIELRILQDGKVYRSKAEQQRLNALGQWHHRRVRRRNRFRF